MAVEDAYVFLARGASDRVSVKVDCVTQEMDPTVAHLGAGEYGLGGVGVEVSDPSGTVDTTR